MARQHILIVNDNALISDVTGQILKRRGYRVTTAENGLAALAALATEVPDLMLLAIQMLGMSGEDVVMTMQQDIPFLIHSTLGNSDPRVAKLMELGALGRASQQTLLADVARALDG